MKNYLVAFAVIGALTTPALAADSYYVVFDKTTKTCSMATSAPSDTEKFSMMGTYGSEADAKMAMAGMTRCNRKK
jgi:hypothetical protein